MKVPMYGDVRMTKIIGYADPEWTTLSKQVRERDKKICFKCGQEGNEVHHIIPRKFKGKDNEDNLITLCKSCHSKVEVDYLNLGKTAYVIQMLKTAWERNKND